ncbi:hypothetical protein GF362_05040 [Candidatus Dojkabacteria bacterium]|nr:hypothetical protein [Candidatus Dojkabacteria bacterium]
MIKNFQKGQVLQASDSVTVEAVIAGCELYVSATPEKRVNDYLATILTIEIYEDEGPGEDDGEGNYVGHVQVLTNSDGYGTIDICDQLGEMPPPGVYDFYARAYSHLRKGFVDLDAFYTPNSTLDLTDGGSFQFLAGETSNVFDNKINSLDISTQINHLYTDDYKNDLNQDDEVNSLDLSNTIFNFYLVGE